MTLPDEFAAPASAKSPAQEENDGNSPSIKNEEPGVSEKKGHSLWTRRDRPVSSKFEPLRSLPSLLVFLADMILPVDQRSIYALPLLYLHGGFSAPIYKRSWVLIIILWLLPELSLPVLYSGCILYDQYWREKLNRLVDHWGSDRFSFTNYVCHLIMLYAILYIFGPETMIQPVIVTLECLFGPVKSWYRVILSTQTILLIPHRRGRLNASVAEGKEGILLALLCYACCAVLSCPLQWACYLVWSIPDFAHPLMFAQWIVSSASWFYLEVPPVVAYLALLWLNQYPHADISFEKWSGGPSSILRRERSGTLWLGTTTLLLRICDIYFTQAVGGHLALLILLIVLAKWPEILLRRPYFRRLMTPWIVLPIKRFSYEPICEDDEFRLLRLLPQARSSGVPIQCEMIHETLKSAPPYTAISYHWGNPSLEEMIEIFINGSSFKVSPTVHSLLLAERGPKKSTVVWIDSICIKQSDNFEKTRQVCLLMRPIFQQAERVIGWLGENNNSKSALAFVRDLHRSARPEHSNTEFGRIYRLAVDELEVLLRNPWFERAWIIQEVAVSENLVLRHGDEEVTWRQLAKIIFLIFAIDSDMVDPFQEKLCHNTGALNVLLLDNIRRQVEERNPLKLKDLMRLGLRFKATLAPLKPL